MNHFKKMKPNPCGFLWWARRCLSRGWGAAGVCYQLPFSKGFSWKRQKPAAFYPMSLPVAEVWSPPPGWCFGVAGKEPSRWARCLLKLKADFRHKGWDWEGGRGSSRSPSLPPANTNHSWLENGVSHILRSWVAFLHTGWHQAGLRRPSPALA